MAVLGVGTDVVDIPTFTEQLTLPGSRLREVFTARERRRADERAAARSGEADSAEGPGEHLAAVWALKEAFVKAWSGALYGAAPPLAPEDLRWTDIEVRHDRWGRPRLDIRGAAREAFAATVPASGGTGRHLHASASHDGRVACALVVLESE